MKPNDDRETLSALFDGELDGEARLFAMRRLSHDTGWQDDCGRWQLLGDVMRRQAPIAAPADFAGRVCREVAALPPTVAASPAVPTVAAPVRRPARLWAGGALAASLALVGLYAVMPGGRTPAASATVAAVPERPRAAVSTAVAVAPPAAEPATTPSPAGSPADASIAAPSEPARLAAAAERPTSRTSARPAHRDPVALVGDAPAVAVAAPAMPGAPLVPVDASNPFHVLATDPLAARPWPRAALGGAAGLTASYGTPTAVARDDAPSFYPFEPRLHGGAATQGQTP